MASTTSKRHRMRCRRCSYRKCCSGRFTLPRHPDSYKRPVKCACCGNENVQSAEKERRAWTTANTCRCSAYPFLHRRGALRFCQAHPKEAMGEPATEDEIQQYQACLLTERTKWMDPAAEKSKPLDELTDSEIPW